MIIIHDLAQATAALATAERCATPVVLRSPPDTSAAIGPGIFAEQTAEAAARHPSGMAGALFDCGDQAGLALAAIRRGGMDVLIALPEASADKIKNLANQAEVAVVENPDGPVLDLAAETDPAEAVRTFLETLTS